MKIAIIGIGRVGSATAFCLAENSKIDELLLIDRTRKNAEGLKADLMGTFPGQGGKIKVGDFKDANDADIILITAGSFGAPAGSSLWDVNKPVIEEIFTKVKPKKGAKLVIITTPSDKTAYLAWKLSGLDSKNVIGFGGQLDVNRLKYLICSDRGDFSKSIEAHFIGEHGSRGIPVFREVVSDRNKIIEQAKNYFGLYLAAYGASTHGTARELAKLTNALMSEEESVLNVSYYDDNFGIFVTWPCVINKDGIKRPIKLELTAEEERDFRDLIEKRKNEEGDLFRL